MALFPADRPRLTLYLSVAALVALTLCGILSCVWVMRYAGTTDPIADAQEAIEDAIGGSGAGYADGISE